MVISFFIFNYKEVYAMIQEEQKGTKLTLQIGGTKISWESPSEDHDMGDLIDAFQGLCVGMTWLPITFVKSIGQWYDNVKTMYSGLNTDGDN